MKYIFTIITLLLATACLHADEKHYGPEAIEISIETGSKDGELKFVPDNLSFERG